MDSEELFAYELGYRAQAEHFFLDIAAFYNVYDHLILVEQGTPFFESTPASRHLVIPLVWTNKMDGETYGMEIAATWDAPDCWRLSAGYSYLRMQLHSGIATGERDEAELVEGGSPRHQFNPDYALSMRRLVKMSDLADHLFSPQDLVMFSLIRR